MTDVLLTVPQAASRIGMSTRWMWDRVRDRDLPVVHLGGKRKIKASDLDAFVDERTDPGRHKQRKNGLRVA